jgi:hypothetical protein
METTKGENKNNHQNITTFKLGDENHPVNSDDEVNYLF